MHEPKNGGFLRYTVDGSIGCSLGWEVSGCLNPVLIDIVPRRQLASAFAWNVGSLRGLSHGSRVFGQSGEVAIVFTSGNMIGPMFVGLTAQHLFNYKLNDEGIAAWDKILMIVNFGKANSG